MKHRIKVMVSGLVIAVAALSACSESVDPPLGTSAEALTRTLTIRRGTFGTVADTTISASALNRNFGATRTIQVSAKNEALLRFDLASIPANAVVQSANLILAINGGEDEEDDDCDDGDHEGHRIAPIKVRRVTAAWAEGTVTYRSFNQQFAPAVVGTIVLANRTSSKTVDVSALVQGWVTGTYPNVGLILTTTGRQHTLVVASEHPNGARRPTLEIRYAVPEDHCAANPCAHGACTNTLDGFTCACDPGFDGATCGHDIDDCAGDPCVHGACTDGVDGFTCACAAGYDGATCANDVDDCAPNPCANGGTCTDGVASHTCACPAGTSGADCEVVDACSATTNPCQNGGACTLLPGNTYSCACTAGFVGGNCETNPDDCPAVNPCSGHGTCADGLGSYSCACDPGYTGTDCQTVIDHCVPDACANGGACTSTDAGFTCACAPGYDGPTCANDINDCAAQPCQNGGQCVDGVDSFTCACPTGTGGPTCEGVCQARTIVAADTEFPDANWALLSGGSPTDEMQSRFGSQVTTMFEILAGQTQQTFSSERRVAFTAGTYDPAVSGPLARVDYSFDAQDRTGFPRVFVSAQLLLLQGGSAYSPPAAFFGPSNLSAQPTPGPVTTTAETNLTAADFTVRGAGPGHPDFSAQGAPITFGYLARVVNINTPSSSRLLVTFALDNYSVTALPAALDCDNVDECATGQNNCAPSPAGVCTNTVGSFACSCADGFTGDGTFCRPITALTLSPPASAQVGVATTVSARLARVGAPAGPIVGELVGFVMDGNSTQRVALGVTDENGVATVAFTPPEPGFYRVQATYQGGILAPASDLRFFSAVCRPGYSGLACDQFVCDPSCAACSGPAATECTACDFAYELDPTTSACVALPPVGPIDAAHTVLTLPASVSGGSVVHGTIQARDAQGQNARVGGASFTVAVVSAAGASAAVTPLDNGDGSYSISFSAPPFVAQLPASFEVDVSLAGVPAVSAVVALVP